MLRLLNSPVIVSAIKKSFDRLSNQLSEQEIVENQADLLMFRFLSLVESRCKELGWNRKLLAEKIGTSASYITQLFRGDKVVNLVMLAKFQKVLGIEFEIKAKPVSSVPDGANRIGYLCNDPFEEKQLLENITGEPSGEYEDPKSGKKVVAHNKKKIR